MFFLLSLESRNTPEVDLSKRSAKRKAFANDRPVQKKNEILEPSTMFKDKYQQQKKLGQGGFGCVFAVIRIADNLPVTVPHMFLHTCRHTHSQVRKCNQKVLLVSPGPIAYHDRKVQNVRRR